MTSAGTTREVLLPELRVVAVSNDGTRLVLKSADATEYTLPIDERLRAAVRNDRARLGQIEIEVESHLRPRDIQARIRAGATAEEVAQLAAIPVERVRRFEGPVLAERAFMAERARKTPIRRQGESTGPQLGDAVAERLLLRGAEKDSPRWDSWRRDDGTWEVILAYRVSAETHSASWSYDPPRRLVQPNDDEARTLIGESPEHSEPAAPFVPRIARLPRDHAEERGSPRAQAATSPAASSATSPAAQQVEPFTEAFELEEAQASHADRTTAATDGAEDHDSLTSLLESVPNFRGDLLVSGQQVSEPATAGEPVAPEQEEEPGEPDDASAPAAGAAYADILMPPSATPNRDRLHGNTDRQAEADGVRPGRRATVPSWDEIVFGSRRGKE